MLRAKTKRLEALLKLMIVNDYDNQKKVIELFNELVQEGYPRELLKNKMRLKKEQYIAERETNDFFDSILEGVKVLTPEQLEQIEANKKVYAYFNGG